MVAVAASVLAPHFAHTSLLLCSAEAFWREGSGSGARARARKIELVTASSGLVGVVSPESDVAYADEDAAGCSLLALASALRASFFLAFHFLLVVIALDVCTAWHVSLEGVERGRQESHRVGIN